MKPDRMDDFIRENFPAAEAVPERVERVMASVMARIDALPEPRRPKWLDRFREPFATPVWVGQYAIPLSVAAMLGAFVANQLVPGSDPVRLGSLLVSSSLPYLGY